MPLKEMVQNDNTSLKLVVLIYHHDSLKMINQLPGSVLMTKDDVVIWKKMK